tara:strand:+ start:337 stop:507 length:171 start_codon:yes stop_codon:yes gene_type:complete
MRKSAALSDWIDIKDYGPSPPQQAAVEMGRLWRGANRNGSDVILVSRVKLGVRIGI